MNLLMLDIEVSHQLPFLSQLDDLLLEVIEQFFKEVTEVSELILLLVWMMLSVSGHVDNLLFRKKRTKEL